MSFDGKPLVDHTYEEVINAATRDIHDALLQQGAAGMRSAIWKWMNVAIDWRREIDASKKPKRGRR